LIVGILTFSRFTSTGAGSGPRHLEFDPETGRAFLITELDAKMVVYNVDEANGDLVSIL
jgi:6-phosphogluconolactonase (cycloisomerase 2 family)